MLCSAQSFRSTRFRSRPRRRLTRGFSLVEMLVVVAIVGLLVALVGPAAMRQLQGSRTKAAEIQIAQLRAALDIYLIDIGRYPTSIEGLAGLVANAGNVEGWNGPYLRDRSIPEDPWGNRFIYKIDGREIRIISLGEDGRPGGEGRDADIEG